MHNGELFTLNLLSYINKTFTQKLIRLARHVAYLQHNRNVYRIDTRLMKEINHI